MRKKICSSTVRKITFVQGEGKIRELSLKKTRITKRKNCLGEKMLKFMLLKYNYNLFGIVTFDVERYATSQLKKTKVIKRKTYRY